MPAKTTLDKLCSGFRVGPLPHRLRHNAAAYYGLAETPSFNQVIAYVRHHFTNYERVSKRILHSQLVHFEFKCWVNQQIEATLAKRGLRRE